MVARRRMRTIRAILVAGALCLASAAPAGAHATAAGQAASGAAPAAGPGVSTLGLQGWTVQSTATVEQGGDQVSTPGFPTTGWLRVTPDDAGAPGTELQALLQNGVCLHDPSFPINQGPGLNPHHVFFSDNLRRCYGHMDAVGQDTIPEFNVPWWFRTDFTPDLQPGEDARLVVNGVVGQADVWLNGVELATQATVRGAFTRLAFDVTDLVRPGVNSLALELFPNNPSTMLTTDDVDWNQIPPDNNTGIQFPVQLHVSRALGIDNAYVTQDDAPDLSSTALTVKADVTNNTATAQAGTVSAVITPPAGGGAAISVAQQVTLPPASTRTVTFAPGAFPQLTVGHPLLWWPYQMGGQPLYRMTASVSQGGGVSDAAPAVTFGVRTITERLTAPSAMAPDGAPLFAVNGRSFVFRGGGFVPDFSLHYSAHDIANQVSIIRSMGLDGIRTEGKEMPAPDFYEQMDRAGILIDAGFQCCDFWQPNDDGSGVSAPDYRTMELSSLAIGMRLRDHPSVMNFSWSDNNPIPQQELVSLRGFAEAGFQQPIVASAEYNRSALLGPSGQKEGPYDYVPPAYWYDTGHASHNAVDNDPTLTNVGGSWGFDSEQSAGDTVPTADSIQRFLSAADQAALWQQPCTQQFHLNYESPSCEHVGYAFGTLFNFDQALTRRYGSWSSLAQYVQQAQVLDYENTRAQFEAFIDHSTNVPTPSTGTVYWQLNKGWPTLLWSLYNSDYDLAGSYFGAKKANETLHALYAYDDGTVTLDNLSGVAQSGVSVRARVRSLDGAVLDDQTADGIALAAQGVRTAVIRPRTPAATVPPAAARAYFVELVVRQGGVVVDRNVYWLSTQQDVVDWTHTQGNPNALVSDTASGLAQWADLRALQGLPRTTVTAAAVTTRSGDQNVTTVRLTNPSRSTAVAFFLRADVRRGSGGAPQAGDSQVLPITWSDDDVTLWPGQSQTVTARYASSLLGGADPVVTVSGWNVPGFTAAGDQAASEAGLEDLGGADGTPLETGGATPAAPGSAGPGAPAPASAGVAWKITSSSAPAVFTQGDAADRYTITVTNGGTAATDGRTAVTLTDVVDPDLTLLSISGKGWQCDTSNDPTEVCTAPAGVLAPGQSLPPLTLGVKVGDLAGAGRQSSLAGLHVTNAVSVAGGSPSMPQASLVPVTRVTGPANLTATNALASAFRQGDPDDRYQVTVINRGAGPTTGSASSPIVATVQVPAGETPVALYGSGWTCHLEAIQQPYRLPANSCVRTDVLRGQNGETPPITLVVSVSPTAPATVTQRVTVSGGGETAGPVTIDASTKILPAAAPTPPPGGPLAVGSAHAGSFAQGDAGGRDRYTLTVRNAGAQPAAGPVTVTDALPAGLAAFRMTGDGWTCSLAPPTPPGDSDLLEPLPACSRSDALAPGASYPPITLAVDVAGDARPSLTNHVTVASAGASAGATDATAIGQRPDLGVTVVPSARGVPLAPFARGDGADQADLYRVTVGNEGFGATSGTVTLTVDLPAGLTALSMSGGADWSCQGTTCTTRPGVTLAPGAQRTVTLQVAVSGDAPDRLQPLASVSGGAEIDPSNDFFAVPTFVGFSAGGG